MNPPSRSKEAAKAARRAARTPPPGWRDPLAQQQPLISGRWLVRAVLVVVAGAAISAYLTLCLLFYQGQWQVVFHPSRQVTATPASAGLKYDEVRFDYTGTGVPQLAGWWIPADPHAARARETLLFLHDGKGSLSDAVAQLKTLHSLGVNIFAFDYRGFGNSINTHPSEQRVYEDTDDAWNYLTDIRHLDPKSIVLYGQGLGATIAAQASLRHPDSPALILESPAPPALSLIEADARTSILPVRWLFHDRFEIAMPLRLSKTRRLLLATPKANIGQGELGAAPSVAVLLTDPPYSDPQYLTAISSFLDSPGLLTAK